MESKNPASHTARVGLGALLGGGLVGLGQTRAEGRRLGPALIVLAHKLGVGNAAAGVAAGLVARGLDPLPVELANCVWRGGVYVA